VIDFKPEINKSHNSAEDYAVIYTKLTKSSYINISFLPTASPF